MKVIRWPISQARIESETSDRLIIGSRMSSRLGITILVGLLLALGVISALAWWSGSKDLTLTVGMGAVFVFPALVLATFVVVSNKMVLNAQQRTLSVTAEYLLRPRREQTRDFAQVIHAEHRKGPLSNDVELTTDDGLRITLQFGIRASEAVKASAQIGQLLGCQVPLVDLTAAARLRAAPATYDTMLREIRSWAFWMLGLGALHMIVSRTFSTPWGILLIVVGLASFYFRDAAMFVVYAVTLAWAGLSNLLSATAGWQVFALFQLFLVYVVFQQFLRFRRAQIEQSLKLQAEHPDQAPLPDRCARIFPWAGLVLGSVSLTGLVLVFFGAFFLAAMTRNASLPRWVTFVEGLVVDGAVLGFAVGLGAWLSGCQRKIVAIVGCVLSALTLLIELGLVVIGKL
jgi:hypothetical protein